MRKLFSILTDSLLIWSRNFTLIYVFLLAWFVLILLTPAATPALEMRWVLLVGVMLLFMGAMMAALFNMVALACDRFLSRPREQALRESNPIDAITLFKAFLPGISQFMAPMVGGFLIQIGMAFLLLFLPAMSLLMKYLPWLRKVAAMPPEVQLKALQGMPISPQDDMQLSLFMLAGMFVYALFALMTILWPAFVVYYRENPIKACFRSMTQFFKDPLTLIGLVVVLLAIRVPMGLLNSVAATSSNLFLALLVPLLYLFSELFIAILVFVYVYRCVGKPVAVPEEPEPPQNDDAEADRW